MAEPRKKFYEEVNLAIQDTLQSLIEAHPELEGAVVALSYSPEIGDPPACLVLGDLQNTALLCRLGSQAAKLQQLLGGMVTKHFDHALRMQQNLERNRDGQNDRPNAQKSVPKEDAQSRAAFDRRAADASKDP